MARGGLKSERACPAWPGVREVAYACSLSLAAQAGLCISFTVQPELTHSSWARPCSFQLFLPAAWTRTRCSCYSRSPGCTTQPLMAPWLYYKGTRSKHIFFSYYHCRNRREVQHDQLHTSLFHMSSFSLGGVVTSWAEQAMLLLHLILQQDQGPQQHEFRTPALLPGPAHPFFLLSFLPSHLGPAAEEGLIPHPQTPLCGPWGQKWVVKNCSRPVFGITLFPAGL